MELIRRVIGSWIVIGSVFGVAFAARGQVAAETSQANAAIGIFPDVVLLSRWMDGMPNRLGSAPAKVWNRPQGSLDPSNPTGGATNLGRSTLAPTTSSVPLIQADFAWQSKRPGSLEHGADSREGYYGAIEPTNHASR